MKPTIFIDGEAGTTGLQIRERLSKRDDIRLIEIDPEKRKDALERKKLLNSADYVFLCLPDSAAIEAVSLVENDQVRIIDASTAHRVNPNWVYGFPELSKEQRLAIKQGKRIANPGCYATGFISLTAPLIRKGILDSDVLLTCHALSGYSGAGKKGILQYESEDRDRLLDSPRQYGLTQGHKHLPEMMKISGLTYAPVFNPIICDFPRGMVVSVPLHRSMMAKQLNLSEIHEFYQEYYSGEKMISVLSPQAEEEGANGFIASNELSESDRLQIIVCGNEERFTLLARLDNLGKGASGAAVQNLNIMMGVPEETGLSWEE